MTSTEFSAPAPPRRRRYLLLGARGSGMSALANILTDAGHDVVGTDLSYSAADIALTSQKNDHQRIVPWLPDALPVDSTDVCVFTPAIPATNPLLRRVRSADIPTMTLHQCLADVLSSRRQLCVAGTHGKTTTSAMLAWILHQANYQPSFFVGGELIDTASSGCFVRGEWAVVESCEFSNSFHTLQPQMAVLTGIERDHFDCFPEQSAEDESFQSFLGQLPHNGPIIVNADCTRATQLATFGGRQAITVGLTNESANWQIRDFHVSELGTTFFCHHGSQKTKVQLKTHGLHNVRNAAAAIAAAFQIGISTEASADALQSFSGVKRRFEQRGIVNGITLIDDYAHHPTAIRETIRTARAVFPGRRIVVAFEPHQVVRTRSLFPDFLNSLQLADETLLLPVFPAREDVSHLECCRISGRLVKELNQGGSRAFLFANLDQIVSRLDHSGRPSDVFITMGAGRTNLIHDELTRRFQQHFVA